MFASFAKVHFSYRLISSHKVLHVLTNGASVVMLKRSLPAAYTEDVFTLQLNPYISQGIEADGAFCC